MRIVEINGIRARVAESFWKRLKGLVGTKHLPEGEGLLFERCSAIHTCFMSMAIDAIFLDSDNNIVRVVRNIKPWRWFVYGGHKAVKVLEVESRP